MFVLKYTLFLTRIVGYEEFPRSSLGKIQILSENDNLDIDKSIDKQLVSPSDPDIDFKGMIRFFKRTYFPPLGGQKNIYIYIWCL